MSGAVCYLRAVTAVSSDGWASFCVSKSSAASAWRAGGELRAKGNSGAYPSEKFTCNLKQRVKDSPVISSNPFWKKLGISGLALCAALAHGWALLALYFWFGGPSALALGVVAGYALLVMVVLRLARHWLHGLAVSLVLVVAVVSWWSRRVPELGLRYPQETEQAAKLVVDGNLLTVHAMRNFRYRNPQDFNARWATRTYDLNQLENVDLFFNNWGVTDIDHVITSFVFKDQPPLAVSIELRAEQDEPNTLARGIFKQYELFYLWADEQDVVALRSNYRKEQVSLHRTSLTPASARRLLLEMATRSNELLDAPEFYNTLTDNCTNAIARHVNRLQGREVAWYRRPLLTGKYVRMGFDEGWLPHTQPWEEFRAAAIINDRAQAAGDAPGFSQLIRTHLPVTTGPVEQYPSQ